MPEDTIAAIASPLAPSPRIILRLSGPHSHAIAQNLIAPPTPVSEVPRTAGSNAEEPTLTNTAQQTTLSFNNLTFPAWIYTFHAPRSYTGEDSIELHIPGSTVLAKLLLDELYKNGARPAEPGEFTARAFFNGKLGLTQAEGVAATIAASNEAELRAARQLLAGELARRLMPLTESLAQTLALIEVGIDFTEEDVTFLAAEEVTERIEDADESLADLLEQSGRFEQLTHEPRIVLAGRPNAGKSSLINALVGKQRAIVSSQAGTTRDVLTAQLSLPSGQVQLADVAGLEPDSQGHINEQMQQQATAAIASADYLLCVQDCTDDRPMIDLPRKADLVVLTKSDLQKQSAGVHPGPARVHAILVSSITGDGLDSLRAALDHLAFARTIAGTSLTLNRRHLQAINTARESLARAAARVTENAPELVAMDLRDALDSLGSITGQVTPDDILGRVFSAFCIGK